MSIKAVIFDIGGVCAPSPMPFLTNLSESTGLPSKYISYAMGVSPSWKLLERGEASISDAFFSQFTSELLSQDTWRRFHAGREPPQFPDAARDIKSRDVLAGILAATSRPDRGMVKVIRKLKESGKFKLGVITNDINLKITEEFTRDMGYPIDTWNEFRGLFDTWVSSSTEHIRKPEEGIYRIALERLGVKAEETAFLDDIGGNLKAAKKIGINPIRVEVGKVTDALRQLEKLTGLSLVKEYEEETTRARL